jgi:hypothetical protein
MATRNSPEKTTSERLAGFIHRAAVHAEGISRSALTGRPVVEIANSWSEPKPVLEWADGLEDGYWHFVSYHETAEEATAARKSFEQVGAPVLLGGIIAGSRFYMFDTEPLFGRMFEIAGGDLSAIQWLTPEEAMRAQR